MGEGNTPPPHVHVCLGPALRRSRTRPVIGFFGMLDDRPLECTFPRVGRKADGFLASLVDVK